MTSPPHRSRRRSLLAVIAVGSALAACGDASAPTISSSWHPQAAGTTGTPSAGSGGASNGAASGGSNGGTPSGGSNGGTPAPSGSNGGATPPAGGADASTGDASGGTPSDGTTGAAFDVTVDNASPSVDLAETSAVQVTVTPQSYTGSVALTVTGLPADITGTFDSASLSVSGTTAATAKLTLKSLSSSKPVATPFTIVATAGTTTKQATATLTVNPVITVKIPVNVDANEGPQVFGTIKISAPANLGSGGAVTVNFLNLDSTPHEIHAGQANEGFPHGAGTFGQNQQDFPRNVTATGTYKFYLHDEGGPLSPGTISIQ